MRGEPYLVAMVRVYPNGQQSLHPFYRGRETLEGVLMLFPPRRQEPLRPFRYAVNVYLKGQR